MDETKPVHLRSGGKRLKISAARKIAEYVFNFNFQDLPEDVVHQTKRVLLDTLGCAIGGYDSEARQAIEEYVKELGHPEEATVFGSGLKTSCLNATLANGAMVRYLDYNDTAFIHTRRDLSDGLPSK